MTLQAPGAQKEISKMPSVNIRHGDGYSNSYTSTPLKLKRESVLYLESSLIIIEMVTFQAVSWEGKDIESEYTVTVYGRCKNGKSASVSTLFSPYFFIKKPPDMTCRALEFKIMDLNNYQQKRDKCQYPIKVSFVERKDLWGFSNNEMKQFACLEFKSLERMRRFASSCKYAREWTTHPSGIKVYENTIEPLLRFMHLTGIQSTGWLEADGSRAYNTTCDVDIFCDDWRSMKPVSDDSIAPLKIMSLDIESYSSTGRFPDAKIEGDVAFQVAFTTKVYGTDEVEQICFCVKETKAENVVYFETEKEMFQAMWEYIVKNDPDIITGWNIFGFDLEYMYRRTIATNDPLTLCIGRRQGTPSELVEKVLASSALGQNVLKMLPMPGRYIFDLFQLVKAEHKLESYSLNNVSKQFLGDQKNDMPIKELFAHFASCDAVKLGEVAEYCMKDTELPIKLMEKLYTIENLIEMAKATWVPLNYLSERGQQIKVFSQIAKKARELKFMIPTIDKNTTEVEFEGATVLEAQTGAYYTPITALDFEGLYPSIMIAHNLCYSTIVNNPKYDNLPGVTYEDHGPFRFAQNVESLLPAILVDLKKFRKKAKGDMAAAKGTNMYHVYNGKQLAYKISMNSVYGFTGASKGMLPLVAIASTVTGQGRFMIQQSKDYVEAHFPGSKVRYGDTDSIMVEFDTGGRTGKDAIAYSWDLGEQAAKQITGLFKPPNNLELEKIYCPYFLYSKKRYAAKMWVKEGDEMEMSKIDIKGLQVVRRDSCPFVRDVCQRVIEMNMESEDPREYVKEMADMLINGQVPIERLILSKRLGDSYKSSNLAHVAVRDKMKERAPGSEPLSGDRVQFVIVCGQKKDRMYQKSEDPKWVVDNNIPLDYQYYYKHQFESPVNDLII